MSATAEEQKILESLQKKLKIFDQLCFEKCIKDPQRKLGNNEEHCLRACNIKMLNAISFMSALNHNGGVDRLQPIKEAKGKSFF